MPPKRTPEMQAKVDAAISDSAAAKSTRLAVFRVVEDVVRLEVENRAGMPANIHFPVPDSTFALPHDADEQVVEFDFSPIPLSKQQERVVDPVTADGHREIMTMAYAFRIVFARYDVTEDEAAEIPSSLPRLEDRVSVKENTPQINSQLYLPHRGPGKS